MKNKNFKAAPASPEESARIQRYWIDNFGAKSWINDNIVRFTNNSYLYLQNGFISWGDKKEYYDEKDLPIFSIPDEYKVGDVCYWSHMGKEYKISKMVGNVFHLVDNWRTLFKPDYKIEYPQEVKKEITIDDLHIGMEVMLKPWDQIKNPRFLGEDYFNKRVKIYYKSKFCNGFKASNNRWYHFSSIDHIIKNDNKMKESRFPLKLELEQARCIINAACLTWKDKLTTKWGNDLLTKGHVNVYELLYKEMREACTSKQHELLDELFGKEVPDIKKGTPIWARHRSNLWWVYGKFHSFEEGKACLITIYDTKSNQFDDYSLTPPVL